jgi:hypothetical protein
MGLSLMLYLGEGLRFDPRIVRDAIVEFGGVRCARPEGDTTEEYDYEFADDYTTLRIPENCHFVSFDGRGPASQDAALKIQRAYPQPITLIDDGYSFQLQLTDYHSVAELDRAIADAYW